MRSLTRSFAQHVGGHRREVVARRPAPLGARRRVVERFAARSRRCLAHRVDVVVDREAGQVLADLRRELSGVKFIAVTLKALRCTRRAGSASISSIVARIASGMYIMSSRVSGPRKQV